MDRNYVAFMKTKDGEIFESEARNIIELGALSVIYDEALRLQDDYSPVECGVRVYTPDVFRINNWKDGKYWKGRGTLLYTIPV